MIVVSDTSPITALLTVAREDLLRELFGEVLIPDAVLRELRRAHREIPDWLRVAAAANADQVSTFAQRVDRGEAEALALALEIQADWLLVDERKARKVAQEHGIRVIGLVGIVVWARHMELIPSARELIDRLEAEAGVYLSAELRDAALERAGEKPRLE